MKSISVLGSLNMDLVISTNRLPIIGETTLASKGDYLLGGKGANQAVAASRLGVKTSIIGCVGNDAFGTSIIKELGKEDFLDTSSVEMMNDTSTGLATVFKLPRDNSIVVLPGANNLCSKDIVDKNADIIINSDVLLCQLEIPLDAVMYALKIAKEHNVKTILNPAPYKDLPDEIFNYVDYITPNDTEFESMCSKYFSNEEELEEAMISWSKKYNTTLIVTRGKNGCSYVDSSKVVTIPTLSVDVVDTTGAGDTFNGIFSYALANDLELSESIALSSTGASLSVRYLGAQTGMPTKEELKKYYNIG